MSDGEYEEALGEVEAMVQRSVDYWRARTDTTDAEIYVDAYRCVQENIKTIKDELGIHPCKESVNKMIDLPEKWRTGMKQCKDCGRIYPSKTYVKCPNCLSSKYEDYHGSTQTARNVK